MTRPRLLFVAPWFLLPADSGGKIRTGDILRGMKGGRFEITLASPLPRDDEIDAAAKMDDLCDRFVGWPEGRSLLPRAVRRASHLFSSLPVSVADDRNPSATAIVQRELDKSPDVVVVDFPHTAVVAPPPYGVPSVMFTHNVEAEIYERHTELAANPLRRWIWGGQARKMDRFERQVLRAFDTVVAVSRRDREILESRYGLARVATIPTGVDVDRLAYKPPPASPRDRLVFVGAMDWAANIDAMRFMLEDIWPCLARVRPGLEFHIIGRNPPEELVREASRLGYRWSFEGFVDELAPHVHGADVYVIPIRVGSGTRMKAFEAMAFGRPVVSTSVGVEGLDLTPGTDFLRADAADSFAASVLRLLGDAELRRSLAERARTLVAERFSSETVARVFESICADAAGRKTH